MDLQSIKKVGVAGAGTMGAGIAQTFAENGYEVVLYDLEQKFLDRGRQIIDTNHQSFIAEEIIDEKKATETIERINFTTDKTNLAECDFIIEAIIEKMDIKHQFWSELSKMVKKDAILTTNTSGLSITEIAKVIPQRELFAGMHWWNPPHIIPLVEIIKGNETSQETAELLIELSKKIGKKPVLVKKDVNGFIGNRIQFSVLREALHIVEQGIASYEDVDAVLKYGLGFRYAILGPFETADLGGLDTFYYITTYLFDDLSRATGGSATLKKLVDNNNLGVKTGKGFYDYSNGRDKEVIKRRDLKFLKMLKHIYSN